MYVDQDVGTREGYSFGGRECLWNNLKISAVLFVTLLWKPTAPFKDSWIDNINKLINYQRLNLIQMLCKAV